MTPADHPTQLDLLFARDATALKEDFSHALSQPVTLHITNNTSTLFTARQEGHGVTIRAHHMLLAAPSEVITELAGYFKRTRRGAARKSTPLFRQFIRQNSGTLKSSSAGRPRRRAPLVTMGKHHDLAEPFARLNARYFHGSLRSALTWGAERGRGRVRTLGAYYFDTDTIRISRHLDRPGVPRYYLEFVLYHEMLHASMAAEAAIKAGQQDAHKRKRRIHHGAEFRKREQLFEHYERALRWERTPA